MFILSVNKKQNGKASLYNKLISFLFRSQTECTNVKVWLYNIPLNSFRLNLAPNSAHDF